MPVRYWFRCDICGVVPDDETRRSIGASTREDLFGELIDAMPGKWLVWHGRGLYGPARYACPIHRGELTAYLRHHYGTVGWHPWKRPPYPTTMVNSDMEKAEKAGGLSAMPKWGYGPQIK